LLRPSALLSPVCNLLSGFLPEGIQYFSISGRAGWYGKATLTASWRFLV
jgi:hypothetical protein